MTDQISPGLSVAEDTFKHLVWDNAITAVLVYFRLDFWPINAIARMLGDKLFDVLKENTDVLAIRLLNAEGQRQYDKALVVLAILGREKGVQSDAYKQAREAAKAAMSRFTRINQ